MPQLKLMGAGGEPVDFRRTLASHGVAELLPNRLDEQAWTFETTLAVDGRARTVRVSEGYLVTPLGDEVYVPDQTFDIRPGVEACLGGQEAYRLALPHIIARLGN